MLLTVRDIHKTFTSAEGPFAVLRGVDLCLDAGETLALTGESGSGKSTLLHLVGGLDVPDRGSILLEGADVAAMDDTARAALRRGTVGLVFQQFNLIPSLTVAANIAFQARLAGRYDADWCAQLADRLGLVLADEPTGNLDEATAADVMGLMLELVQDTAAGLLMVTHSARLAGQLQRRVHLKAGHIT